MITAARGDSKPCVLSGCTGIMQFGRESLGVSASVLMGGSVRGWVCDTVPGHFMTMSGAFSSGGPAAALPQSSWDDDGGTGSAEAS